MDNFTKGISNLTGPDPNRIPNGTKGTATEKSKNSKKKVGICPSKEETAAFSNDVLKFINKRLKPGAGVVIAAGLSPVGLPIIKVGIGKVENITMACEFHSDNPFLDLEVCMPQARFVMDISSDDESGKP
jgi:hypothetical protein